MYLRPNSNMNDYSCWSTRNLRIPLRYTGRYHLIRARTDLWTSVDLYHSPSKSTIHIHIHVITVVLKKYSTLRLRLMMMMYHLSLSLSLRLPLAHLGLRPLSLQNRQQRWVWFVIGSVGNLIFMVRTLVICS
jgi:hypothetical protein